MLLGQPSLSSFPFNIEHFQSENKRNHLWASLVAHRVTPDAHPCGYPLLKVATLSTCLLVPEGMRSLVPIQMVSAPCTFPGVWVAGPPPAKAIHLACGSLPSTPKALWASPPGPLGKEMGNSISSTLIHVPRSSLLPGVWSASFMGQDCSCEKWYLGAD